MGLVGAVTDFGQLLLLFTRRDLERYEFTAKGREDDRLRSRAGVRL